MKHRVYKKLCKKAAEFFPDADFDGVHYMTFLCSYDSESESSDCWPWLVGLFDADVNTVCDEDSECGISWVNSKLFKKATPKNVFKWAREWKREQ